MTFRWVLPTQHFGAVVRGERIPKGTFLNWKYMPLGIRHGWAHWIRQGESYEEGAERIRLEHKAAKERRYQLWKRKV